MNLNKKDEVLIWTICHPQVVIYSSDLTNLHNITGEQIGAYFGYSLCVLDMDGDGLDDIVV